jgi:hypothetical protein
MAKGLPMAWLQVLQFSRRKLSMGIGNELESLFDQFG